MLATSTQKDGYKRKKRNKWNISHGRWMKGWPIFSDVLVWFVGQLCSKYIHSTFSTLNLMCNITILAYNSRIIGNLGSSWFQNNLKYFDVNKINQFLLSIVCWNIFYAIWNQRKTWKFHYIKVLYLIKKNGHFRIFGQSSSKFRLHI